MDCREALELLEVVRPDADDLAEPELATAAEHLDSCAQCQQVVARRRALDRRIADAFSELPVPAQLSAQLVEKLNAGASTVSASLQLTDSQIIRVARSQRRRAWLRVVLATACVALIVGTWFLLPRKGDISLAELRDAVVTSMSSTSEFDGGFAAQPPGFGWQASSRIRIVLPPTGISSRGDERHEAAVYRFQFRPSNGAPIEGMLLAAPVARVADVPTEPAFNPANVEYVPSTTGGVRTAAWTEGNLVYVCIVPASASSQLDELYQELRRTSLT